MGVLQARILEWVAMTSSRGSSQPRDGKHASHVSCIGRWILSPLLPPGKPQFVVQFSHSVVSDSWQSHRLQNARLPCPSPTPGACSNSCPSSQSAHPTISSSVVPFSSRLQSFPALGSFLMSQFFESGGQRIGASAFSISPSNEHSGLISFRMDWLDLLAGQGTLKSLLQHHSSKASILQHSAFFIVQLSLRT